MESILVEREEFASTLLPAAANMTALALGDYAKQIFRGCGERLVNPPDEASSDRQIPGKSPEIDWSPETAAQTHAVLRARSAFDISQLASEYRALRASVLRLWTCKWELKRLRWRERDLQARQDPHDGEGKPSY
jgi:hypothetical protein